ncbi:hypothetical protein Hanom_Chr11g00994101 [Helianthus anomalus]
MSGLKHLNYELRKMEGPKMLILKLMLLILIKTKTKQPIWDVWSYKNKQGRSPTLQNPQHH